MSQKGASVVAWQVERGSSVANKAANPLHWPLRKFPLPDVVQQLSWYHPVKGPHHVMWQQCSHAIFALPSCMDLLDVELEGNIYRLTTSGPHVHGREKALHL